jgi:hypothetical protein
MTQHIENISGQQEARDANVIAALLDALCSPHLYEIAIQDGVLRIEPRAHMHRRPPSAGPETELSMAA